MNKNAFCACALGISLSLIVVAIVLGIRARRSELKKTEMSGDRRALTAFQVFLLCFFFAAVAIFFPIYYVDYLEAETGVARVIKAILLSAQNVLRLITLNGEFDNVRDFLADTSINAVLGGVYSFYAAVIVIAAPLLTAGFVLSFFRNVSATFRYSIRPCRELYVMSELNERSLAVAKNVLREKTRGRLVIFADVFEDGGERNTELIFSARQLGAICVKKDVTDIGLKYAGKCMRKIYLFGDDEDENLRQALKLINRHRGTKYDNKNMEFYVFSRTAESGALLDSVDKGNMRVRRVNESFNLALTEMQAHSLFATAKEKKIRIAIVGLGGYGMQFLKMICCLGQMPEHSVELHVFDREDAAGRLKAAAPELSAFNGKKIEGDAEYSIVFHNNIDVKSVGFIEEFSAVGEYTGVYVTLGEDELNIETAMHVRTMIKRFSPDANTPIYAIVYDPAKAEIVANGGLRNHEGKEYGITFIGSLSESFSLKNIERQELEESGKTLHTDWARKNEGKEDEEVTKQKVAQAEKMFDLYEYHRKSSMVQAVYRDLRGGLGYRKQDENTPDGEKNNDSLRRYEHRRWNTYMRGEGYIYGEKKDHIAKTHPLLVPFDDLPEEEKKKDDF